LTLKLITEKVTPRLLYGKGFSALFVLSFLGFGWQSMALSRALQYPFAVSIFSDRKGEALLVIDVQTDVVAGAWHRDHVVANINSLVTKARQSKIPVIWIQHSDPYMEIGTDAWKIVRELEPLPDEPIIQKRYRSSFEETELEVTLAQLGVGNRGASGFGDC